jgi:alpha-1,6-mannosyltransferase
LFASLSRRVPRSSTFRRDDRFVKIVRLANYVAPASGGLRTALAELGAGYLAAGHEPVLVVPGARPDRRQSRQGLVIRVPGVPVPGTGGYRAITARRSLRRLLEELQPDRLEVSDRTTLRWTGAWARRCGIRSMMVSHDSLAALAQMFRPPGLSVRQLVDRLNRNTAASFDVVVCTTAWAAAEFRRLAVPNVVQVPLGVDLAGFHPSRFDEPAFPVRPRRPAAAGALQQALAGAATWPTASRWRSCSRPRMWSSPPARPRRSAFPLSRRWPAAPRWW